jgi:Spy/CpxP family protein refolding chaperone
MKQRLSDRNERDPQAGDESRYEDSMNYKDKFMKTMKYSVIAALALGGLVATTPMTFAADTDTKPAATEKGRPQRPIFEKWAKELSLTDAQSKDAKVVWEKRTTAMKELRAKKLERTEARTEMQKIQKEFNDGMNKILTDDQKAKLKELQKAGAQRGQGRNRAQK